MTDSEELRTAGRVAKLAILTRITGLANTPQSHSEETRILALAEAYAWIDKPGRGVA